MEDFGELACACGAEHFERITVQRRPGALITTDFVACTCCSSMYYQPLRLVRADPALERDAAVAANGYRKPSRPPKLVAVVVCRWWVTDARTGRRRLTQEKLSAADAAVRHPGAEADPASVETRYLPPATKV